MKIKNFTLLLIISFVVASSCRKHHKDSDDIDSIAKKATSVTNNDVFIAGYDYAVNGKRVAAYWKNGVLQKLSDSTSDVIGNGIVLQDTDVVIAGTSTHSNTDFSTDALYWRNGRLILLEKKAEASCITTSPCGCDLYVGGDYRIDNLHIKAIYWKDGTRHPLPSTASSSAVNGVAIHGTDVYATGEAIYGDVAHAVYWKNDTLHNLTDSLTNSIANAIAVNGNDVYVVGSINDKATYWKNGVSVPLVYGPLPGANGIASAITIENGNIYIGGSVSGDAIGVYWKNGIATTLMSGAVEDGGGGLAVKDGNVYVAGAAPFGTDVRYPAYWINGTITRLPGAAFTTGLGIAVKARP